VFIFIKVVKIKNVWLKITLEIDLFRYGECISLKIRRTSCKKATQEKNERLNI